MVTRGYHTACPIRWVEGVSKFNVKHINVTILIGVSTHVMRMSQPSARQRAAQIQLMTDASATWSRTLQSRGSSDSLYINVPAEAVNILNLEKGDDVDIELDLETGDLTFRGPDQQEG